MRAKKTFNWCLSLLFLIHLIYPDIERIIYTNEIFSSLGFLLFFINIKQYVSLFIKSNIFIYIFFVVIVGLIQVVFSFFFLNEAPNAYYFFRTITVWYSVFCFFIGYSFIDYKFINFYNIDFAKYILLAVLLWGAIPMDVNAVGGGGKILLANRIAPLVGALLLDNYFILAIYLLLLTVFTGDDTALISFALSLGIIGFRVRNILFKYVLNPTSLFIVFAFALFILFQVYNQFNFFYDLPADLAYASINVEKGVGLANIIWRLMFWAYEFNTITLNSMTGFMFGVGFGTPIYDTYNLPDFLNLSTIHGKEEEAFVLGVHNSFLFVLFRQGFLMFSLVFLILCYYFNQLREFANFSVIEKKSAMLFLFTLVLAAFNVVLESSLFACIFWISLGQFIKWNVERKNTNVI